MNCVYMSRILGAYALRLSLIKVRRALIVAIMIRYVRMEDKSGLKILLIQIARLHGIGSARFFQILFMVSWKLCYRIVEVDFWIGMGFTLNFLQFQ